MPQAKKSKLQLFSFCSMQSFLNSTTWCTVTCNHINERVTFGKVCTWCFNAVGWVDGRHLTCNIRGLVCCWHKFAHLKSSTWHQHLLHYLFSSFQLTFPFLPDYSRLARSLTGPLRTFRDCYSVFLQAGCLCCCPTNSIEALKWYIFFIIFCYSKIKNSLTFWINLARFSWNIGR